MQMVVIIFRSSLEEDVLAVLKRCHIRGFSDIAGVLGSGETGSVLGTFDSPGSNSIVLTALDPPDATRVVDALRDLHTAALARQHGRDLPLHVFLLPCEQVV